MPRHDKVSTILLFGATGVLAHRMLLPSLYGLHADVSDELEQLVKGFGPVTLRFGQTSIFPANNGREQRGGSQYDVLKIDIEGDDIHRLNSLLQKLDHTSTFPDYHPHATLAYLKPGEAEKYCGANELTGKTVTFGSFKFSGKDRRKTPVSLGGDTVNRYAKHKPSVGQTDLFAERTESPKQSYPKNPEFEALHPREADGTFGEKESHNSIASIKPPGDGVTRDNHTAKLWDAMNQAWDDGRTLHVPTMTKTTLVSPEDREALRLHKGNIELRRGRKGEYDTLIGQNIDSLAKQVGIPLKNDIPKTAEEDAADAAAIEQALRDGEEADKQAEKWSAFVDQHFGGNFAHASGAMEAAGFADEDADKFMAAKGWPTASSMASPVETKPHEAIAAAVKKKLVEDFGEKIGGARKDDAKKLGPKSAKSSSTDERPAWARRYEIAQIAKSSNKTEEGKWSVTDEKDKNAWGHAREKGQFSTKEEAEAAIPLIAVSRNHRVTTVRPVSPQPATADEKDAEFLAGMDADMKEMDRLRESTGRLLARAGLTRKLKTEVAAGRVTQQRLDELIESGSALNESDLSKATQVEQAIRGIQEKPMKPPSETDREYAIERNISDRKRAVVKGGFKTADEARQYMASHAAEIIEHKFPRYETYAYLDRVQRDGPEHKTAGDVTPDDFQKAFNFRGGEFGNWQSGKDGVTSLNHAYDALHDLSDAIGLPPKSVSLNGDLAIAFGARGTGGKDAARAHYEPDARVMNLTKLKGAGSLAHEWAHAIDHHLEKDSGGHFAVSSPSYKSKVRPELAAAAKTLRDAMHGKQIDKAVVAPKEEADEVAELKAKHPDKDINVLRVVSPSTVGGHLHNLNASMLESRRWKFERAKKPVPPLTKAEEAEWDDLTAKINGGDVGEKKSDDGGRLTYANVEQLNQLHKKLTGRSFHSGTWQNPSPGHHLVSALDRRRDKQERVKQASAGQTERKTIATSFLNESQHMDSTQVGNYYSEPHEMLARAFEAYVSDNLKAKGIRSDYLVSHGKTQNAAYAAYGLKPFPEGEEREQINAAFDQFFAAMKHEPRKDERGEHVRLYSRQTIRAAVRTAVMRYAGKSEQPRLPAGSPEGGQFARRRDAVLPKGIQHGGASDIGSLYDSALSTKGNERQGVQFATVESDEARRLKGVLGVDVEGFHHVVDNFAIRHSHRKHGGERERLQGQLPLQREDFVRIPDIIASPDSVSDGGVDKLGNRIINYEKRFNGTLYLAQEIRTGERQLALKSLWKRPSAKTMPPEKQAPASNVSNAPSHASDRDKDHHRPSDADVNKHSRAASATEVARYARTSLFDDTEPRDESGKWTAGGGKVAVPGSQMGLFGGDDLRTGQKSLFNVVKDDKPKKRHPQHEAIAAGVSKAMRSYLANRETVSPADLGTVLQEPALPGQKSMFSRIASGVKEAVMRYRKDASGHEHKAKGPDGGQFTSTGGGGGADPQSKLTIVGADKKLKAAGIGSITGFKPYDLKKKVASYEVTDPSGKMAVMTSGEIKAAIAGSLKKRMNTEPAIPSRPDWLQRKQANHTAEEVHFAEWNPAEHDAEQAPPPKLDQLPGASQPLTKLTSTPDGRLIGATQMHVGKLKADPRRFQYKVSGIDHTTGTNAELKSVSSFNPELGGQLLVWQDPNDGQAYVVNGHHRYELASRSEHGDDQPWNGMMSVYFVNAKTPEEARARGALANIAEGRGTSVDAAKFLRDTGGTIDDLKRYGVSEKGKLAQSAMTLSGLSDHLFQKLANEGISEGRAVAIAKHLPKHDQQNALVSLIDKKEEKGRSISDGVVAEMARAVSSMKGIKSSGGLFDDEHEDFPFEERATIADHVRRNLSSEQKTFKDASSSRRASALQSTGTNTLDVAGNADRAKQAAIVTEEFDHRANAKGHPVAEALDSFAGELASVTTKSKREAVLKRALAHVRSQLQAQPDAVGQPASRDGATDLAGSGSGREHYSRQGDSQREMTRLRIARLVMRALSDQAL